MLEIIATLFEPILFNPFDIRNDGITVAKIASRSPYHHKPVPVFSVSKFPLIMK